MERFLTIVAVIEGAVIAFLVLLNWKRTRQVFHERKEHTLDLSCRRLTISCRACRFCDAL